MKTGSSFRVVVRFVMVPDPGMDFDMENMS